MTTFIAACIGLGQPTPQLPVPRAPFAQSNLGDQKRAIYARECNRNAEVVKQGVKFHQLVMSRLNDKQKTDLKILMQEFQEFRNKLKQRESDDEVDTGDEMKNITMSTWVLLQDAGFEWSQKIVAKNILYNRALWHCLHGEGDKFLAYTDQDTVLL